MPRLTGQDHPPREGWNPVSTYLYLVCPAHETPVRAVEESGQHYYDLPQIRFDWLRREHWLAYIDRFPGTLTREYDHLTYFQRRTWVFLREHRDCQVPPYIVSEYGDRFDIEAPTIDALLTTEPSARPGLGAPAAAGGRDG